MMVVPGIRRRPILEKRMKSIRRPRRLLGAVAALAMVAAVSAPAGAWSELSNTGDTGYYEGPDQRYAKGAVCKYDRDYDLVSITIKPPSAHSYTNGTQKIGYRYIIERDTQPYNGDYVLYYRSKFVYDTATPQAITGFPTRTFAGFPGNPQGNWRVRVVLKWVKPGTSTKTAGLVHGVIDSYKAVKGPFTHPSSGYCSESY